MTIIEGADYFVYLIPLPESVGGILTTNNDDTYTMYLNEKHTVEQRLDDYIHEFTHIINDDLFSEESVAEIEKRTA